MSDEFLHLHFERLGPQGIERALSKRSVVYIPLGTLEWHCWHLPVGLDALTAHGLCLRAAAHDGGLVLPPLYYGTGGDHGGYPWTIMMPLATEIEAQIEFTLRRLQDFGVSTAVLFSGHFADGQLEMIDRIAARHATLAKGLLVIAASVNRLKGLALAPDHAGIFETTLLAALHPNMLHLERLPELAQHPLANGDVWAEGRHDPTHPIWGVIGPDPRHYDQRRAAPLLDAAVQALVDEVRRHEQAVF